MSSETVSDRDLTSMIQSMENHGSASLASVYAAPHLSALRELQSLRSKPVASGVEVKQRYGSTDPDADAQIRQLLDTIGNYQYAMAIAQDALASIAGEITPKRFPETAEQCAKRELQNVRAALEAAMKEA